MPEKLSSDEKNKVQGAFILIGLIFATWVYFKIKPDEAVDLSTPVGGTKPAVKKTTAPTPAKNDSPRSCTDAKENILRAMKEGGSDKAEASAASMYTFCTLHEWPQKLTDCFANASDYVSMVPCLDFATAAAKLVNMAGKPASTANRKALADYWSYSIGSEMRAVVSATGKRARILRVTQGTCSESYLETVIAVLVDIDKLKESGFRGVECHDGDKVIAKRKL